MEEHDLQLLTRAAQLAEAAYDDDIPGAKKIENKRTSTTAYLLRGQDIDYLTIRGTQRGFSLDWLFNALIIPFPVKGALIHLGFYLHLKGILKEVYQDLNPGKRLVLTGHSLGGGACEVLALLCRDFKGPISLICWGKPNLFSRLKRCRLDHLRHHYSFVHGSDIVARIPRYGFRPSTGNQLKQVWFSNEGTTFINPSTQMKRADWALMNSVSDHGMAGYRSRLAQWCMECRPPQPKKEKKVKVKVKGQGKKKKRNQKTGFYI